MQTEASGYEFRKNQHGTETTVYRKNVPIYRFGTNPKMDAKDYQDTCSFYASLLGRVIRIM